MIEFKGKFDESITNSFMKNQSKKTLWLWIFFAVFFVLIGGIFLALYFYWDSEDSLCLIFGIVFIILGLLYAPIMLILVKRAQKKATDDNPFLKYNTTQKCTFYPDRFTVATYCIKDGASESEYEGMTNARYTLLQSAEETKDTYILQTSKAQAFVFKKSDLTQGTLEELNQILSTQLADKFKRPRA